MLFCVKNRGDKFHLYFLKWHILQQKKDSCQTKNKNSFKIFKKELTIQNTCVKIEDAKYCLQVCTQYVLRRSIFSNINKNLYFGN